MFQSRNRESYLFKTRMEEPVLRTRFSFNLVIENLIFSSHAGLQQFAATDVCFNLVIENLIFSSEDEIKSLDRLIGFQSRNRESYLFKVYADAGSRKIIEVSIS